MEDVEEERQRVDRSFLLNPLSVYCASTITICKTKEDCRPHPERVYFGNCKVRHVVHATDPASFTFAIHAFLLLRCCWANTQTMIYHRCAVCDCCTVVSMFPHRSFRVIVLGELIDRISCEAKAEPCTKFTVTAKG